MSEALSAGDGVAAPTAGSMLRDARQAQGLHIAALAAAIKVSQRKLESLEADRISELPDATFARALAQTVCRSLKIDPVPVLAALPQASGYRLEGGSEGINKPFRDRPGRHKESGDAHVWASPAVWVPVLIVAAATALYLLPAHWIVQLQNAMSGSAQVVGSTPESAAPEVATAASATTEGMLSPTAVVAASPTASASLTADAQVPIDLMPIQVTPTELSASASAFPLNPALFSSAPAGFNAPTTPFVETVHSTPDAVAIIGATASGVAVGPLQVKATEESWVEVVDAKSQVLVSRMLQRGETVVLDGAMPFKLKLGNASGVSVAFRGASVDLAAATRGNVARLELK